MLFIKNKQQKKFYPGYIANVRGHFTIKPIYGPSPICWHKDAIALPFSGAKKPKICSSDLNRDLT